GVSVVVAAAGKWQAAAGFSGGAGVGCGGKWRWCWLVTGGGSEGHCGGGGCHGWRLQWLSSGGVAWCRWLVDWIDQATTSKFGFAGKISPEIISPEKSPAAAAAGGGGRPAKRDRGRYMCVYYFGK
nr:hypothetical protein [Tanacetum cinerariifolium]